MTIFQIIAVLLTLTAAFGVINYHFIKLPTMVGVMVVALIMASTILGLSHAGLDLQPWAHAVLDTIDFDKTLLDGMLSFLLFAGALHLDLGQLRHEAAMVAVLATAGVVTATAIVGVLLWLALSWVEVELSLPYCLVFGALISPTDPIAVLGILRQAKVPKGLEVRITGESLFNDGVGVVIFIVLLGFATGGGGESSWREVGLLFLQEAVGGAVFGLLIGVLAYRVLKGIDDYRVEIMVTLALVTGGYALASLMHMSGPIAIVVAGLLIGNQGRKFAMSNQTRDNLDAFWEITDEILNAVLFVLIGLELLLIDLRFSFLLTGLIAIPVVLLSRFVSVGAPMTAMRLRRKFGRGTIRIMTWGGLRGGISVALALTIGPGAPRDVIVTATYVVVLFSILVQGMTIAPAVRRWMDRPA